MIRSLRSDFGHITFLKKHIRDFKNVLPSIEAMLKRREDTEMTKFLSNVWPKWACLNMQNARKYFCIKSTSDLNQSIVAKCQYAVISCIRNSSNSIPNASFK